MKDRIETKDSAFKIQNSECGPKVAACQILNPEF